MIKNLWGWGDEIRKNKTPKSKFTPEDWDKFEPFMINRLISMDHNLLGLVNELQEISNKEMLYDAYKDLTPKSYKWHKWVKGKKEKYPKELLIYLNDIFKLSTKEIKEYVELLSKEEIVDLLKRRGVDDKEIKKLIKVKNG